ncbi:hypothetical protein K439DRAFT_1614301 [Ramaria rubella]|nr:hypothetical protein K439DRAFT_1614301 [Ramaria rubella]
MVSCTRGYPLPLEDGAQSESWRDVWLSDKYKFYPSPSCSYDLPPIAKHRPTPTRAKASVGLSCSPAVAQFIDPPCLVKPISTHPVKTHDAWTLRTLDDLHCMERILIQHGLPPWRIHLRHVSSLNRKTSPCLLHTTPTRKPFSYILLFLPPRTAW